MPYFIVKAAHTWNTVINGVSTVQKLIYNNSPQVSRIARETPTFERFLTLICRENRYLRKYLWISLTQSCGESSASRRTFQYLKRPKKKRKNIFGGYMEENARPGLHSILEIFWLLRKQTITHILFLNLIALLQAVKVFIRKWFIRKQYSAAQKIKKV